MSNRVSLTSPGRIGTMTLRNRMFQTAMGYNIAEPDGTVNEATIAFAEARARGGAALVNVGAVGIGLPDGGVMPNQVSLSEDRFIPGVARLARAIQAHGARFVPQLQHGGLSATEDMIHGRPLWTPSIPTPSPGVLGSVLFEDEFRKAAMGRARPITYRIMDQADIDHVVGLYAAAARRAVEAGADGIELHGAHGYMIRSFLSPLTNHRTDQYGGPVENRARFLVEILTAIRAEIGRDFPLWCKINVVEFNFPVNFTVEDACVVAKLAEQAGADAITCSTFSGSPRGAGLVSGSVPMRPGHYIEYAAKVREHINIPVIAAGRVEPELANEMLGDGRVDFIGLGRKVLADPAFPAKLAAGRREDIRPCIYCFMCLSEVVLDQAICCAVNPATGRETELQFPQTANPCRVVVIGGGPGGMESARLLEAMGHSVVLLEASDRLGGTARIAAIAYEPNGRLVEWHKRQLAKSAVDIRLSTRATVETVRALNPDAVVVATGAARPRPDIPGNDQPHVHDGNDMRSLMLGESAGQGGTAKFSLATRALMGAGRALGLTSSPEMARRASELWMPIGKRVVVIGGDLVGLELAEFLAHRGRTVAVVDDVEKFGKGLYPVRRGALLDELQSAGVPLVAGASEIAIGADAVTCRDAEGNALSLPADNVILAKGATAELTLAEQLRAAGLEVHTVGDCNGVGYIAGAMKDASELASGHFR